METNGALLTIMYGVKTNGAPYIIWNEVFYILNERKGSHFDGLLVTIQYEYVLKNTSIIIMMEIVIPLMRQN